MCRNMTDAIIMDYLKIARERGSRPGVGRVLLKVSGMRTRGSSLLRISRARSRCSSGGGVGISSGTCFLFGLALSYIRP